jgi:hypothetical protein
MQSLPAASGRSDDIIDMDVPSWCARFTEIDRRNRRMGMLVVDTAGSLATFDPVRGPRR